MTPSLVIDGIGSISFNSFFLLQFFYSEQLHRMECLSQEPVLFEDVLCQMHDMIQPAKEGCFTLADLRRHKQLAGTLFNMLFNLHKFIAFETRDPFLARQVSINQSSATICTEGLGRTATDELRHGSACCSTL